jgi:hypothetical protein
MRPDGGTGFAQGRPGRDAAGSPRLEDAMSSKNATIEAGAVTFALLYRNVGEDRGVTIHVMGKPHADMTELLRFDCFEQIPHYHYAPLARNERINLDKVAAGDPLDWALGRLRTRLPEMLEYAGFSEVASRLDAELVRAKLDEVSDVAHEMER